MVRNIKRYAAKLYFFFFYFLGILMRYYKFFFKYPKFYIKRLGFFGYFCYFFFVWVDALVFFYYQGLALKTSNIVIKGRKFTLYCVKLRYFCFKYVFRPIRLFFYYFVLIFFLLLTGLWQFPFWTFIFYAKKKRYTLVPFFKLMYKYFPQKEIRPNYKYPNDKIYRSFYRMRYNKLLLAFFNSEEYVFCKLVLNLTYLDLEMLAIFIANCFIGVKNFLVKFIFSLINFIIKLINVIKPFFSIIIQFLTFYRVCFKIYYHYFTNKHIKILSPENLKENPKYVFWLLVFIFFKSKLLFFFILFLFV